MGIGIYRMAERTKNWLDEHNGGGREETGMRILKVSAEAGEAADAWAGVTGQNPRKGITHTRQQVAEELADVALTALVAIVSLGYNPEEIMAACEAKTEKVIQELPATPQ